MEIEDVLNKQKEEEKAIRTELYKERAELRPRNTFVSTSDKTLDEQLANRISHSEKRDSINQRVADVLAVLPDKEILALYENENQKHSKESMSLTERGPVEFLMEDMHKESGVARTSMDNAIVRGQSKESVERVDGNERKRFMDMPAKVNVPTPTDYLMGRTSQIKQDSMSL